MTLPASGQISLYDIAREWMGYNAPNPLYGNWDPRDSNGGGVSDVWNIGSFYKRTDAGTSRWATASYKRVFGRNDFKLAGTPITSNYGTIPTMSGAISFSNFYGTQIGET